MNHMTIHFETPRSKMQQMMGPDICVPVSSPVSAVGRVKSWQRPALKVVRTLYRGSYEGLSGAWHEFGKWTEAYGCKTSDRIGRQSDSAIDRMVIGKISAAELALPWRRSRGR